MAHHWFAFIFIVFSMGCSLETDEAVDQSPSKTPTPESRPIQGMALEDVPVGDVPLTNVSQIIEKMNLLPYQIQNYRGQNLKIAILDNGFMGVNPSIGKRLPPDTELLTAPGNTMSQTEHGTKMAEIVYATATGSSQYIANLPGPKMILLNTNGFTNFKWAVDEVIRQKVDLVLYAQVWEYGGNVDGQGFINAEVQRAIDAGITWVNAAGNFGLGTYHSHVAIDDHLNVKLPYKGRTVRIHVPQNYTSVKIVLAWNDFTDSPDYSTRQDLDLILFNDRGDEITASRLLQEGHGPEGDSRYSSHAREIIKQTLDQGTYHLKIVAKSDNFDTESRLRIMVDGMGVTLLDRSQESTVLMPADHSQVIAVGASDAAISSIGPLDGQHKPEISVPSEVVFADGTRITGTSAASAIAVGALACHISASGDRQRFELLQSNYLRPFLKKTPN